MGWEGYALIGMLLALALASPVVLQALRESRLNRAGLTKLGEMTLEDMIVHMGRLAGALGYRVFRPLQADCGFELILVDGLGQRRGVVVRYYDKLVDDQVLSEVTQAAGALDLPGPMLVSVQGYTYKAREAAAKSGAILWSLPELTEAIGRVRQSAMAYPEMPAISTLTWQAAARAEPAAAQAQAPAQAEHVTHIEPKRRRRPERVRKGEAWSDDIIPKCPRCGRKMVVRKGADKDYWGCPIFPRCLGTRPR